MILTPIVSLQEPPYKSHPLEFIIGDRTILEYYNLEINKRVIKNLNITKKNTIT
jgi:hypothetical protein